MIGLIVRDALIAGKDRWNLVVTVIGLSTISGAAFDATLNPDDALRANSLFGLVTLYLQVLLTAGVLGGFGLLPARYDPRRPTLGRFPAAFGQSLIYVLGVALGFLLLVIPGLILIVRWSLSLPALIAEDLGVTDSLRRSWQLTRRHWKPVAQIYGLVLPLLLLVLLLLVWTYPEYGPAPWASAIACNLLLSLALCALWLLAVSLYHHARMTEGDNRIEGA